MECLYKYRKSSFALLTLIFISFSANAQTHFDGFINPEINLDLKTETLWSYTFGIAHRSIVFTDIEDNSQFDDQVKYEAEFIELNQYTHFKLGEKGKATVAARYRFKDIFIDKHDELRLLQQYSHKIKFKSFTLGQRLRFAQRFREELVLRWRYRIGASFKLSPALADKQPVVFSASTESVWEFGKYNKPSLGQRFTGKFSLPIGQNSKIDLGLEYRHRNYTHQPFTELFLISGLNINL